ASLSVTTEPQLFAGFFGAFFRCFGFAAFRFRGRSRFSGGFRVGFRFRRFRFGGGFWFRFGFGFWFCFRRGFSFGRGFAGFGGFFHRFFRGFGRFGARFSRRFGRFFHGFRGFFSAGFGGFRRRFGATFCVFFRPSRRGFFRCGFTGRFAYFWHTSLLRVSGGERTVPSPSAELPPRATLE